MRNELSELAGKAVELARKAGAQDSWAGASRSRSVSFSVRDGKLEQVKDSTSRNLGLRLFVDGRYSEHSTNDLRAGSLAGFIGEAVALTRALEPDEYRSMPDPSRFAKEIVSLDLEDAKVKSLDREQRLAWCHAMNERVAGKDKVVSATSSASDGTSTVAVASSNGFSGSYGTTRVSQYTGVTLVEGDKRPEAGSYAAARHVGVMPSSGSIADDALKLAYDRLGTIKGETQRTTMVVDNRAGGSLISRLLSPARGSSVQQERSFWRGKLGQKMVSDKLTVVDDPLVPQGLGSRPFDGEGFAAAKMPLIEGGSFQNLYIDTYYGNKLGMKPTTGSSSNRVIQLGARDREAILGAVGNGIYVTSWLGGNMDSTTGDFSFGVRGHLIENGALATAVGEMNVTGNIVELFGKLAEVGSDPWVYSSTPTPTLVFEDVQFSGA